MRKFQLTLLLAVACWGLSFGQNESKFSVTGNMGLSTEFYQFNATDSSLLPRRPDFNYRFVFNPTFHFGKKISVPVNLIASRQFSKSYVALPAFDSPLNNLTNPNNAIGISPTFGWATFHMGTHTANFSELSTGNLTIFGAGIDLHPGKWRIAYSNGMTNWAMQPDTTLNFLGTYQRRLQAMKVGWGDKNNYIFINTTKISDLENSVKDSYQKPQEAALFTVQLGLEFSKHITGKVEVGACAATKDKFGEGIEDSRIAFMPDYLFKANQTTHLDYVSLYALSMDYPTWGLTLQQKKVGAGYVPLGYGFAESDFLDRTISPRLQLFKNRFILNASAGTREDNLAGTKVSTTNRLILSGNMVAMFSKSFSISANYANYGARNNLDNDTLRLEFVSRNFSVSPTYRIQGRTASHTFSANYLLCDFQDKNLFSGELAANKTETFGGSYSLAVAQFSILLSGMQLHNDRSTGAFELTSFTIQPGYALLKRKLNASLGFVYATILQAGYTESKRFIVRPKLRLRLTPKFTFNASGSIHTYRYGSIRNNAMYDESYLQTGITHSF